MNGLSCFLKKFYTTKGNKFVFQNGMTLNSLADEIWQEMGGQGMDSSALSKILNGRRNLISLSLLTKDKKLIKKSLKTAEEFIQETISDDNDATSMLHLGESISLGHLHSDKKNVFSLLKTYRNEFQTSVKERGNYTVSGIKSEIKMHSLVGNDKSENFKDLIMRGIDLSKKYNYPRYLKFFLSFS